MRKITSLFLFQALASVISGILITQMSLLGRIGIHTMYRQFMVFRSWWKTALLLFVIQCLLIGVLWLIRKYSSGKAVKKISGLCLLIGIVGFGLTYWDFTTTMHKVMKARFHFGFYLFWIGWGVTCLYFILQKRATSSSVNEISPSLPQDREEEPM
nr:hypothetical protein [uncultured Capnocytophaga sp.]